MNKWGTYIIVGNLINLFFILWNGMNSRINRMKIFFISYLKRFSEVIRLLLKSSVMFGVTRKIDKSLRDLDSYQMREQNHQVQKMY